MSKFHLVSWAVSKAWNRNIVMKAVPMQSQLYQTLPGSYFSDAFELSNCRTSQSTAIEVFRDSMKATPVWMDTLLWIRNKSCHALFGLKDVGVLSDFDSSKPLSDYKPGDKLSIFTVVSVTDKELVVEDNDKHLRVQVSMLNQVDSNRVTISSVVHVHNWIGRFYMFFVGPAHRFIVPMMLLSVPVSNR